MNRRRAAVWPDSWSNSGPPSRARRGRRAGGCGFWGPGPRAGGFLVPGAHLRRPAVPVVFVTGFADFALPAFDLGAVDYLLKPVSRDRLGRTLARIAPRPAMTPGIDRLCVREGQDRLLLPLPGVLYLRRDDDVTTVALDQNTLRVREALRQLELVLAPHGFFRCHRAYLVNLRRVRRIVPWSRDAQSLLLDDPKETLIPLAKSRIQELRQLLLWP